MLRNCLLRKIHLCSWIEMNSDLFCINYNTWRVCPDIMSWLMVSKSQCNESWTKSKSKVWKHFSNWTGTRTQEGMTEPGPSLINTYKSNRVHDISMFVCTKKLGFMKPASPCRTLTSAQFPLINTSHPKSFMLVPDCAHYHTFVPTNKHIWSQNIPF